MVTRGEGVMMVDADDVLWALVHDAEADGDASTHFVVFGDAEQRAAFALAYEMAGGDADGLMMSEDDVMRIMPGVSMVRGDAYSPENVLRYIRESCHDTVARAADKTLYFQVA